MKKNIIKIFSLVLVMALLSVSNVYASDTFIKANSEDSEDGDAIVQPRSLYLASAISEITNEGEGVLCIYADFKAYEGVEWGQITINLQRKKNANSGSWDTVKTYTKTFNGADYRDGKITYAYTEFDVHGLATDYYYRLTCFHKVKTPSGSYESKTTQTDGVLLTSYPVYRRVEETK